MIFFLSLTAAFLFGISDYSGGHASRSQPVGTVLFSSQIFGLFLVASISPLLFHGVPQAADLVWGGLAGIGGALGISFLYYGLAGSVVSIVSPAAALFGALFPLCFGLLIGDGVGTVGWIGIGLILPAVILLSYEHKEARVTPKERLRAFGLGALAGMGFGLFFIMISRTDPGAGLWPLAGARVASLLVVGLVRSIGGRPLLVHRGPGLGTTITAGFLDMAANIAFMLAVQSGRIILVTAVTSVYPAPTVLLARLIRKEQIHPLRWAGLAAAAAGVACMGIG